MVRVIALTQFAFLALGVVALKIMVHSQTVVAPRAQALNALSLWFFAIPLAWMFFASICRHVDKGPLKPVVARALGVLLAIASFLFLATVTFLA